jgi:hypothetical protein
MARSGAGRAGLPSLVLGASAATLLILAVGAMWRVQEDRLVHLETILARRDARWAGRFRHLETTIGSRPAHPQGQGPSLKEPIPGEVRPTAPPEGPTALVLARIEARLSQLGQRLGDGRASQEPVDASVVELRGDLERMRREMEAGSLARRQEVQELRAVVQEALQLLRSMAMNPRTSDPMQVPVPVPFTPQGREPGVGMGSGMLPGPGQPQGQVQLPGQFDPSLGLGHGGPQAGPRAYPGGHTSPGMQRHGGPG